MAETTVYFQSTNRIQENLFYSTYANYSRNDSFYDNITNISQVDLCNFSKDVWENDVYKITFLSIIIVLIAIATTGGNLLVMISFKIEPQLRTISNCFLLSLAVADITIGIFSIPLYSMYLLLGYQWPLGLVVCDVWLSLDYTMSNASVANLLLISFDRYFSVTRPLTYRAHRTPVKAGIMIALAWIISILLWTPWIMIWPRVSEEKRTETDCYIAFLDNTSMGGIVLTFVTAFGAFFIPVIVMCILYFKIYRETEKRKKNFAGLQGVDHAVKEKEHQSHLKASSRSLLSIEKNNNNDNDDNLDVKTKSNALKKEITQSSNESNSHDCQVIKTQDKNEKEGNNCQHKTSSSSTSATFNNAGAKIVDKLTCDRQISQDKNTSAAKHNLSASQARKKRAGQEQKAAKTLSAILLAFIVTWTPYNIFVLVQTFFPCAIHPTLYAIGYWLCYLNSTINPVCYALCNELFRSSFIRILKCQWRRVRASYVPQNVGSATNQCNSVRH